MGELDEAAVDAGLIDEPDETLALLADLAGATDRRLNELARRLAGRLFVDLARRGAASRRGIGKLTEQPYRPDGGDLDLDGSFEAIAEARSGGVAVDVERLRVRSWSTPETSLCLLVDRSGSMGGKPLATAAVAAAAVALRSRGSYSVLAFGKEVVAVKSQDDEKAAAHVVNDLLTLRGHGTTDLTGALRAAGDQLGRSRAARKVAIVLSDCRSTVAGDAVAAASSLPEVVVVAPADECDEAYAFALRIGARIATVDGPSSVVEALAAVFGR